MRVLVIGNGFDMDLGLKTQYKDFINSKEFKGLRAESYSDGMFARFLFERANVEGDWFDIEETIACYVRKKEKANDYSFVDFDKPFLDELEFALYDYVSGQMLWVDDKLCLAKEIIKLQNRCHCFDKIYSFNSFDSSYNDFATGGEIEGLNDVIYVHNNAEQFILGIDKDDCKDERLSFFIKSKHSCYTPTPISKDLVLADDIFIFGHSFNRIDMVYFRDMIWNTYINQKKFKRITFITKNTNTAEQIKENITNYGPLPFDDLNNSCQLAFLYTDNFNSSYKINDVEDLFKSCML